MKVLDIFLMLVLIRSAYSGYKRGLLVEIFSIIVFFITFIVGIKLIDKALALDIASWNGFESMLPYIAFGLLVITTMVIVTVSAKLFKHLVRPPLLGDIGRLAGSIIGIFKWALFMSAFIWLGSLFEIEIPNKYTDQTFLFPLLESLLPQLIVLVSSFFPSIHPLFKMNNCIKFPSSLNSIFLF